MIRRLVAVLGALTLAISLAPTAFAQSAEDPIVEELDGPFGREPEERGTFTKAIGRALPPPPAANALPAKPREDVIEDVPVTTTDASIPLNLIPYHGFQERLRTLQASDRISVEVIGKSAGNRNLYMAVVTSPMSDAEWAEWQRLSDLRTEDPDAAIAAQGAGEYDSWKTPVFVNNNIHGNEWEGTDAAFQVLDVFANSEDQAIVDLLDKHVFSIVVSMNPDGRVLGQRPNENGFDMNRDFMTQSQSEVRAIRDQLIRYNPVTMIDLHGYVSCTLIEPTTGPHGEAYEYDLYIRQAIRNALAMEQAVIATGETRATCLNTDGTRRTDIPWRNDLSGWDDWPPIFTPMYAMLHGSVGHTVEIPLNPRGNLTQTERHERTRINTAVARAAMEGNFSYVTANSDSLLADQLETFRRGEHGESSRPIDDELALSLARSGVFQGYNVDNAETFLQDFPDAYVIPVGRGQRSDNAAARLAQFLIDNDVEVKRAHSGFILGGVEYRQGSYVIDMHQAKRGLAYAALYLGRDVTSNFPTMYDISAWSPGELWGAEVVVVQDGALDDGVLVEVTTAGHVGSVAPGKVSRYGFQVDSANDIRAVNWLAGNGVTLKRRADGTFIVPGTARTAVTTAAKQFGVRFISLGPAAKGEVTRTIRKLRLGVAAAVDEVFALRSMGFDVRSVTAAGFNAGTYAFADFDAFYVSSTGGSGFNPSSLTGDRITAFSDWLAAGGAIVGRGSSGVTFNNNAALLRSDSGGNLSTTAGRSDANGIVAVVNNAASTITRDALDVSFMTAPRWFTNPGTGVRVDQRLGGEGFFLAGHWIGSASAAGQPVVVSGKARGADVTLFTTEPLYRSHPEGMWEQVAEGLWL